MEARMRIPIRSARRLASWLLVLTVGAVGTADPRAFATPPAIPGSEITYNKAESELLHLPLNARRLQEALVWDGTEANWRRAKAAEAAPSATEAPVLIIHLWADWCAPCREEFPVLRELSRALETRYRRRVRFMFVAVETGSANMERFLAVNKERMPSGALYLDAGAEGIAAVVRNRLVTGRLSLPLTLLVDERRIVRQAFLGSIANRRFELIDSIERLAQITSSAVP